MMMACVMRWRGSAKRFIDDLSVGRMFSLRDHEIVTRSSAFSPYS